MRISGIANDTAAHRALPLLALLAAALALAAWSSTPPRAIRRDAAATMFSAERAMDTVRIVAREPHPTGTPQAAAARAALIGDMRSIGLSVSVLRGIGVSPVKTPGRTVRASRVEDLVGVLPGLDRTLPAVAIMAHTDSVPGSFGAADDGAGVAVALETARAIAAGPRPRRDVMLILTDGEEAGLLGAYAFFADRARAARIGGLVNIDARGSSGLGAMFETGPGSGGLVALYRARASHRFAHSAATFLYHQLPNSTDLTATEGRDIPALNFAFLDGEFDYHTPRDRVASLDPRTLQSIGDQVLPTVRAVAAAPVLPARGADGVFGDAVGVVALRYPAWLGWPLLGLAMLAAGWAARGVRTIDAARAAAAMPLAAAAAMLAAGFGYALTGVGGDWAEHHRIMAHFGRYEAALTLAALACVLAASAGLRAGWIGRAMDPAAVRTGTLLVGLLLSAVLQAIAPPLTPLLLWPTLAAALAAVLARVLPAAGWTSAAIGLLPLAYILVFGHAVLLALGIPTPEAAGLFALVAMPLVAPLVPRGAGWAAAGAAIVAAGLLLSFRSTPPSERHPLLSQVYSVADADGASWRVSPLERLDRWSRAALTIDGGAVARAEMPLIAGNAVWRAPAAPIDARRPRLALVRSGRGVVLTIAPSAGGRELRVRLSVDRAVANAAIEGHRLPGFAASSGAWTLLWHAPGGALPLAFDAPPGTQLRVEVAEISDAGPRLPPRPATEAAWLGSDRTIAISRSGWRL